MNVLRATFKILHKDCCFISIVNYLTTGIGLKTLCYELVIKLICDRFFND